MPDGQSASVKDRPLLIESVRRLCAELFVAAEALAQAGDQLDDRWFLEKSERARIAAGGHNHV